MESEPPAWRQWMQAAQQGDGRAYVRLLRSIMPVLGRAARSRWPRATAADIEDVVQETLLAFHSARRSYDTTRPVLSFLLAILRFRGADVIRRRRWTAVNEMGMDDPGEPAAPLAMEFDQETAVDGGRLRELIRCLPSQQRQALEAMKLGEMSLREASAATGTSVIALKVATHRAIRTLRKRLGSGI